MIFLSLTLTLLYLFLRQNTSDGGPWLVIWFRIFYSLKNCSFFNKEYLDMESEAEIAFEFLGKLGILCTSEINHWNN